MKKFLLLFLVLFVSFTLVACGESSEHVKDPNEDKKDNPIEDPIDNQNDNPTDNPNDNQDDDNKKECQHEWEIIEGKEATCVEDGYTDYMVCKHCHIEVGKTVLESPHKEHNYMKIKEIAATSKNTKQEIYRCKDCGDEKYVYLNPLGKSDDELQNLNILLIGNSFTNYNTLKTCFSKVINSAEIKANVVKVAYGSQYLYDYVEGPKGDYYNSVVEATNATKFDVVFLQDQSNNPATNSPVFYDSTRALYNYFQKFGTLPIMYETWTYKGGYSSKGWSEDEMTQRLAAAYQAIAEELNIPCSRAGSAIGTVLAEHPEYVLHNSDNQHPSALGTYIVALTHFATLYGRSPVGIGYTFNDYLKDADITWHTELGKSPISSETQTYIEKVVEKIVFGDSIVKDRFKTSSVGVFDDPTKTQGFDNKIEMDKEVSTTTKTVTYKNPLVSGSKAWEVTTAADGTQAFVNKKDKTVLMFQKQLVAANSDEWHTLSFDVTLLKEVDNLNYARGVIFGASTNSIGYLDGENDGLVLGRRCWDDNPAFQAMRVWNPNKYPLYQKESKYTFDCGFEMVRVGSCFKTLNQAQHIQIKFNLAQQKYAVYVNGELNAYVIGFDLPTGGFMGLYSYDSNRLVHSNFKLDGDQLIFNEIN